MAQQWQNNYDFVYPNKMTAACVMSLQSFVTRPSQNHVFLEIPRQLNYLKYI